MMIILLFLTKPDDHFERNFADVQRQILGGSDEICGSFHENLAVDLII